MGFRSQNLHRSLSDERTLSGRFFILLGHADDAQRRRYAIAFTFFSSLALAIFSVNLSRALRVSAPFPVSCHIGNPVVDLFPELTSSFSPFASDGRSPTHKNPTFHKQKWSGLLIASTAAPFGSAGCPLLGLCLTPHSYALPPRFRFVMASSFTNWIDHVSCGSVPVGYRCRMGRAKWAMP